jgi:8-oxo-dGTP diphosphatase
MQKERFKLIPAVVLLFKSDKGILLQKRKNTGWNDGKWALPGGGVDGSETIVHAAIREAKEELGITLKKDAIKVVHVLHKRNKDGTESMNFFLEITQWEGEPCNLEPERCETIQWFESNNIPENSVDFLPTILKRIQNKVIYGEWGWD